MQFVKTLELLVGRHDMGRQTLLKGKKRRRDRGRVLVSEQLELIEGGSGR